MNKSSKHRLGKVFDVPPEELDRLGAGLIANIIAAGTDIAMVVENDGLIQEIIFSNPDLNDYGLKFWIGKNLRDTVTIESVPKIDRLLDDAKEIGRHGTYQVNHPTNNLDDLPVRYSVISEKRWGKLLVVGDDLRQMMSMQQRLVQTQLELETEYRSLQQDETRYRTVFQITPEPLVLIDGNLKTILDINAAGAVLFEQNLTKAVGKPLNKLFKKSESDLIIEAVSEARHSGTPVSITTKSAHSNEPVELTLAPYRENGTTNLLLRLATEVAPAESDESNQHFGETNINHLPEPVFIIDSKGNVLQVNEMFLDLVQLPNARLMIGRNANNWIGSSPVDLQVLLSKLRDEDRIRGFTTTIRDHIAGEKQVQLSASADHKAGQINIVVSNVAPSENQVAIQKLGRAEEADGFSELVGRVPMKELVRESLDVIEKMCIETALDQTKNNRASAAELLGLSRQSLYIKLRKHGLEDYSPK